MPSLSRFGNAYRAFRGREVRGLPLPNSAYLQSWGIGHQFKPKESLDAYAATFRFIVARIRLRIRCACASASFLRIASGTSHPTQPERYDALVHEPTKR
jgi:hypothetical protein